MDEIRWKLKTFLDENGIVPNRLADQVHGKLSRNGVYRLTDSDLSGVRFESLGVIIPALRELTGKQVEVGDLLEFVGANAPEKRTWAKLRGSLEDPDSPGDMAERHDAYLGATLDTDQQTGTLGGKP